MVRTGHGRDYSWGIAICFSSSDGAILTSEFYAGMVTWALCWYGDKLEFGQLAPAPNPDMLIDCPLKCVASDTGFTYNAVRH